MTDFYEKNWTGIDPNGIDPPQLTSAEVAAKLDELEAYNPGEESDKLMMVLKLPGDDGWRVVNPVHFKCGDPECNQRWAVLGSTTMRCPYHDLLWCMHEGGEQRLK